ncbi:MAG: hypothetical protein NUV91_04890 [Candidatus Omnitrophica bacterium]|nr:hypothetical protein [Candidatus Omnitrophota bacterium]
MIKSKKIFFDHGQSTFEFVFSMICVVLLIIGISRVLMWAGKELTSRRVSHESTLTRAPSCDHAACVFEQLVPGYNGSARNLQRLPADPRFSTTKDIKAAVPTDIYDPVLIRCKNTDGGSRCDGL